MPWKEDGVGWEESQIRRLTSAPPSIFTVLQILVQFIPIVLDVIEIRTILFAGQSILLPDPRLPQVVIQHLCPVRWDFLENNQRD